MCKMIIPIFYFDYDNNKCAMKKYIRDNKNVLIKCNIKELIVNINEITN